MFWNRCVVLFVGQTSATFSPLAVRFSGLTFGTILLVAVIVPKPLAISAAFAVDGKWLTTIQEAVRKPDGLDTTPCAL